MNPFSPTESEWLTRKTLIDPKLKAAGWQVLLCTLMATNMQNAPKRDKRRTTNLLRSALSFLYAGPILIGAGILLWWMFTACQSRISQRVYSPSAEYLADVEEADCGAVGGFETDVILRRKPYWASSPRLNTASEVFTLKGSSSRINVGWEGENQLRIECTDCQGNGTVFERNWKGISIRYVFP